jgi:hypothetical protein
MGLNMKEKQAVTREYKTRYQKAAKKEKRTLLDEFTRLTGYHRNSAVRVLGVKPVREVLASAGGKPVKLKPEKKRPATRKGKRVYTDEVIASLRLIRAFFWYKCGRKRSFRKFLPLLCGGRWTISPDGRPLASRRTSGRLFTTVWRPG